MTDTKPPLAPDLVYHAGVPVLGICYGMQAMAQQLGGKVTAAKHREFGFARVTNAAKASLLRGLSDHKDGEGRPVLDVWMSHGDHVDALPPGFTAEASTTTIPLAAMADEKRKFYGVQFHPEVTHTLQGRAILERFVREICGCEALWDAGNIIADSIARVREEVGKGKVLLGLSGGVDSSVVAALLHRALGQQLVCVFVDHGLLRLGEGEQVMDTFARHMGVKVIRVNAENRFLAALKGKLIRRRSARSSDGSSSRSSKRSRRRSPASSGLRRGRSTRMSSNRPVRAPARPTSSSRITTWAACRSVCT